MLPSDIWKEIAINLEPEEVLNLCLTSVNFNEKICNSDTFWRKKLLKDYNVKIIENPKLIYETIFKNKRFCEENFNPLMTTRIDPYSDSIFPKVIGKITLDSEYNRKISEYTFALFYISNGYRSDLSESEMNDLKKLLSDIKNILLSSTNTPMNRFTIGYINGILRDEIPFDANIDNICEFNIY